MSLLSAAARPARFVALAVILTLGAGLSACGTGGGTSAELPPGQPTKAPPGNLVLYVAMALGNRIDAYRLGSDGLLPSKPFSTIFVDNPRRLALSGNTLYATLTDRIVSIRLGADGTLPNNVTSSSLSREDYDPIQLRVRNGMLYVAASGIDLVQSFVLEEDGDLPLESSGDGEGEYASDYSALAFDDANPDRLYASSRSSQYIDLFLLEQDGNVPPLCELQDPQDSIGLPDDMEIRDEILYVTSAGDRSIHAYKLLPNGYLPGDEDSKTASQDYYADLLLDGNHLYAASYNIGRIDLYSIDANGMLPEQPPFYQTKDDPESYPSSMLLYGGILYVTQGGLNRVDAYVLGNDGLPSTYPSSSTKPAPGMSLPLHMVMHQLD